MRLRGYLDAPTGWGSLIVASILIINTLAKNDAPRLTHTAFMNLPENPEYFDDSDVIMVQDWVEDAVYRTEDAGESWKNIDDFAEEAAWTMYMHPFDKKRAYVLTKGNTHWRTDDRGATWKKFFADAAPSAWRPQPLSFHAGDPDKIIFNGQDCMGIFCEEVVRAFLKLICNATC
jgi:Sortilin, neurotensin receptor 3,